MLWYKGWFETRFRILFMLSFAVFPILMIKLTPHPANPARQDSLAAAQIGVGIFALYYSVVPIMLAGSGIKTQSPLQARRGLHGSMYFTLSMPVSRLRLLAARAAVGMLEMVVVLTIAPCVALAAFPALRPHVTGGELAAYWVTLSVCASFFYGLGTFLSTFLDDVWQNWMSILGLVLLRGLLSVAPIPASVNIFRAMGEASPLFTHTFPWTSMGLSVCLAAVLFLMAMRVVQTQEY